MKEDRDRLTDGLIEKDSNEETKKKLVTKHTVLRKFLYRCLQENFNDFFNLAVSSFHELISGEFMKQTCSPVNHDHMSSLNCHN